MPAVTFGLLGGSGLLKSNLGFLKGMTEETVDTAYGRVFLRTGKMPDGSNLVFIQRHDAAATRTYAQPADINYQAIGLALKAKVRGVKSAPLRCLQACRPLQKKMPQGCSNDANEVL